MTQINSSTIFQLYKTLSRKNNNEIYKDFFLDGTSKDRFRTGTSWLGEKGWLETAKNHYYSEYNYVIKKIKNKQIAPPPFMNGNELTSISLIYIRFMDIIMRTWSNENLIKEYLIYFFKSLKIDQTYINFLKSQTTKKIIENFIYDVRKGIVYADVSPEITLSRYESLFDIPLEQITNLTCIHRNIPINDLICKMVIQYHSWIKTLKEFPPHNHTAEWQKLIDISEQIFVLATETLHILITYLPEIQADAITPLPQRICIGDENDLPAFCGELYLIRAKLLINCPRLDQENNETASLLRLYHAKELLLNAEEILTQGIKIEEQELRHLGMTNENLLTKSHLEEVYLLRAELYCKLAELEQYDFQIEDLASEYIMPCKNALLKAKELLGDTNPIYVQAHQKCQQIFESIQQTISAKSTPENLVHLKFDKVIEQLDFYEKTAYSADFDSVLWKDISDIENLELSIFQIVASGMTLILQLNQIADNIGMLKLLHNPAFQVLCRKGIIQLSCFGNILTPKDYLINNFKKEIKDYEFSSSIFFNHPKYGKCYRDSMAQCLSEEISYQKMMESFPSDIREDMDFCYDSYRVLFELFRPSAIRKFHQNEFYRSPQRTLTTREILDLPKAIDIRIQDLQEDEKYYPIGDRTEFLNFCKEQQTEAKINNYSNRSQYRNLFPKEAFLLNMTPKYQNYWKLFDKLVNYAYCDSNGSRSSDTIYNTLQDDMLRIHPEYTSQLLGRTERLRIQDAFNRYKMKITDSATSTNIMELSNLLELNLDVRRYSIENMDLDRRRHLIEQATHMAYASLPSGDVVLTNYLYKAENNKVTNVILQRTMDTNENVKHHTKDGIQIQTI